MRTEIVETSIAIDEIKALAGEFGDFVKAVVDIERQVVGVGGELHADIEQMLLEHGSRQEHLWGVNLYPDMSEDVWVEFDSMINVRPAQNNRTRSVEDEETRRQILRVIVHRVVR